MIDIHCHILAGVDDGPDSWDISEEMCRSAMADGITHIVATPHANERYVFDRQKLSHSLDHLRQRVGENPALSLGCDFHLSYDNLQDELAHPSRYAIANTNYLLLELNDFSIPTQIANCFTQLGDRGIIPIITHPERNPILQKSPRRVLQWVEQGCAVQVTGGALTGEWGQRAWTTAKWLLAHDAVHVLATDAHDPVRRPPRLSRARDAVTELCGGDVAKALVEDNPAAIVDGKALPYFPKPANARQ